LEQSLTAVRSSNIRAQTDADAGAFGGTHIRLRIAVLPQDSTTSALRFVRAHPRVSLYFT